MIEIIYDDEKNGTRTANRAKYELPKNIRQVGNAPGGYKIYIEDYVMTYLRRIAAPGNTSCRGAILLGEVFDEDDEKVLFISGAVEAQNLEFDISMIKFSDSVWSGLYSEINRYFDNLSIVGWFLSRMGFSTAINDQMKKLHRENFPGDEKVLFLMDSLECEETFYYYDKGSLVREKGYYIYYVRNEKMQNYIISRKNAGSESKNNNVVLKDKIVVENFREKGRKRTDHERGHGLTAVASFAFVCAISLGALWCVSPDTMDNLGQKLGIGRNSGAVQVFMNSADADGTETSQETYSKVDLDDNYSGADAQDVYSSTDSQNTTADGVNAVSSVADQTSTEDTSHTTEESTAVNTTESTTAVPASGNAEKALNAESGENTYVVQAGDTLVSISIKMYNTQNYADKIAEANGLTLDTPIYEGQKLIIPYEE